MTTKTHIIDCNKKPFVPDGWKVETHIKGGKMKWSIPQLYLSEKQKSGYILGTDLQKKLADKHVLNANVLDYLLAHPELIPEEWKGKYIFFWGTIYRGSDDYLYVRYLCWFGGRWNWGNHWLGRGWDGYDPAALRASPSSSDTLSSVPVLDLEAKVKELEDRLEKLESWRSRMALL